MLKIGQEKETLYSQNINICLKGENHLFFLKKFAIVWVGYELREEYT